MMTALEHLASMRAHLAAARESLGEELDEAYTDRERRSENYGQLASIVHGIDQSIRLTDQRIAHYSIASDTIGSTP